MCLTLNSDSEIKIAEEDIVCYKVLEKHDGFVASLYRGFVYEIGKEYKTRIGPRPQEFYCEINEGFHSFLYKEDAKNEKIDFLQYCKIKDWFLGCYRCVIPKGSKIVYGTYGAKDAVVSEAIKIIEEV